MLSSRTAAGVLSILQLVAPGATQSPDKHLEIAQAIIEAHIPAADDPDLLFKRLLETATRRASERTAAVLVAEAARTRDALQRPQEALKLIDGLLAAKPRGTTVYEASILKARLLNRTGDRDGARAAFATAGHVDQLLAIGPFGDCGDAFTGVVFPPELGFPRNGADLTGRYGPVGVRVVKRRPLRTSIDLAPRGEERTGCHYGLHQVVADADTSCYLLVICGGSFEVFVNGHRRANVDRYAQRIPTGLRYGIALRKGLNHVVIKTTLNSLSEAALCYIDGEGAPIRGLRTPEDPNVVQPHVADDGSAATPGPFTNSVDVLAKAAASASGEERTTLLLAASLLAWRMRDVDRGMELLVEIERTPPERGPLAIAYAKLLQDATPSPEEIRRGRARMIVEANAEGMSEHAHVVLQLARFLQDQDKREDAVRLLEARVAKRAAGPATYDRLHRLYTSLKFAAEARVLRKRWIAALPLDTRPILAEISELARAGDARGALALAREGLARAPSDRLRRRALGLARDLGEFELATKLAAELHALEPGSLRAIEDRATTARRSGRTDAATAAYEAIAQHADANARQVRQAGDQLLRVGRREAAAAAYDRSLTLDPSQHDLRRIRERSVTGGELADIARFRRNGDELIAAFEPSERERGATSSLVLDQMIIEVLEDGSIIEETHQIRRINDLRGVEQYQESNATAQAEEVVLLRTVAKDGRSYVPNRVGGTFALPRLEPGVFIEERYRNYSDSPEPDPWRLTSFYFRSTDAPFLLSELVVILPKSAPGSFRTRGMPDRPEVVKLDGDKRAYIFRREDVKPLPTERNAPPLDDVMPVVTWGEDGDFDALARRYAANARYRGFTTPLVSAATREIVAKCTNDREKIEAIHRFVHEVIASDNSTDPTAILMRRRGYRFFLEIAMLRAAGVPLTDAAVAPRSEELDSDPTPFFLGGDDYSVPAALVRPREADPVWLFVDTPRHTPAGFIPYDRLGAPAVLLNGTGTEMVRVPSGRPERQVGFAVTAEISLTADGNASMTATGRLRGAGGYEAAEQLRTVEENVQQVVARQLASQIFRGWTIQGVSLTGVKEKGQPLTARAQLEKRRVLEPAGDLLLLNLPVGETSFFRRWGDRGERTLPFRLTELNANSWEVRIDPGEGYRFAEIPAPVRLRHMLIDFSLTFERDGDALVVRREFTQKPGTIPPAQFAEWLDLLRRLDLAEDANLKLVKR